MGGLDSDTQLKTGIGELMGVSVRIRPERIGGRDGLEYAPRKERLKLYELSGQVDKFYHRPDRDCHLGEAELDYDLLQAT